MKENHKGIALAIVARAIYYERREKPAPNRPAHAPRFYRFYPR